MSNKVVTFLQLSPQDPFAQISYTTTSLFPFCFRRLASAKALCLFAETEINGDRILLDHTR